MKIEDRIWVSWSTQWLFIVIWYGSRLYDNFILIAKNHDNSNTDIDNQNRTHTYKKNNKYTTKGTSNSKNKINNDITNGNSSSSNKNDYYNNNAKDSGNSGFSDAKVFRSEINAPFGAFLTYI